MSKQWRKYWYHYIAMWLARDRNNGTVDWISFRKLEVHDN